MSRPPIFAIAPSTASCDFLKLLAKMEGTRYWPLVALAISTGMRRGELAALRWEQVNLENRTITVQGSYAEIPGKV